MIRIYNARILTMEDEMPVFDGELWIRDGKISYIGDMIPEKAAQNQWDRQINAKGNLIMPGFKNAHTHSAMTFLRSHADDLPLLQWLNEQVFPYEAKLTPEDIYHLSKLAIMEYLTSGITANFDMYLTPDTIAQASIDCGFRTVMTGALNDFTQSLEEMEQWYRKYQEKESLVHFELGFHAEYTNCKENLQGMAKLVQAYHAPVYTHNSEGQPEVEQCLKKTGMTPTAYMDSLGLFEYGGGLYHCVHMTEEDLEIVKKRNMTVVTNPASNLKLASGIAPVARILDKGINLAIGTDGPASNNCLDMFREMFLVTALAKYREEDASVVDAKQVLKMATVGGAKAMNLTDCDILAKGKQADLIMIDLNQPNMQPVHNIQKNLVYSGSKQNVEMTMVAGKILYENGEYYIGTAPDEIYKKADEISRRIMG
ncbi:amidohydrolase family protein [Anaerostipes faecalis]|uniref:amidohydrolase family protein n=1 Tax=Anaerostipes faecalis TaxID=2738446 RepID=UPI001C1E4853|nr:amidohydrolase [Anaerostipes faecalis]